MGRIGVEEAAAVGAQFLDGLLGGHRAAHDGLFAASHGGDGGEAREILCDAQRDEDGAHHDGQGHEDAERAADEVHPEIADRIGAAQHEAAHQGDGYGDADRGGNEVLHAQACDLDGIAQRLVRRIGLPVRVRHEGCGRVERQRSRHVVEAQRERQPGLHALQQVQDQQAHHGEAKHSAEIRLPGLSFREIHADDAIDPLFEEQILIGRVHAIHVIAQRPVYGRQDQGDQTERHKSIEIYHFGTLRLFPGPQNRSGRHRATPIYTTPAIPNTTPMAQKTAIIDDPPPSRSGRRR